MASVEVKAEEQSAAAVTPDAESTVPFALPLVHFSDAWGPSVLPTQYEKMPFATFSKSDRLGKCADFGGYLRYQQRGRYGRGEENVELNYRFDEADAREFSLVDSAKGPRRQPGFRGGPRGGARGGRGGRGGIVSGVGGAGTRGYDDRGALAAGRAGTKGGVNKRYEGIQQKHQAQRSRRGGHYGGGGGNFQHGNQAARRDASVKVEADWIPLDSFNLPELNKLSSGVSEPTDLKWAGTLETFDEDYDRLSAKAPRKLKRFEEHDFFFKSAAEDPLMEEFAQNDAGNVFVTDAVLSHLMACTRSIAPWDIVITVLPGGVMFLDARDALEFELHTVGETAHVTPTEGTGPDDINARVPLSIEASAIHANFTQQVLLCNNRAPDAAPPFSTSSAIPGIELSPNPYVDPEEMEAGHVPASVAYRYRRWKLAGGDITVVARTTVHAVQRKGASAAAMATPGPGAVATAAAAAAAAPKLVSVWTTNEWDAKAAGTPEFRKTFDIQRGNLLATEIKNNAAKLAKFTISSLLAGTDIMKLGFVARNVRTDADHHVIVGTASFPPAQLAQQLAVLPANMWGILRWLVELIRKHAKNLQEDVPDEEYGAKFVIMRDPNTPKLILYNVPMDAFEGAAGGFGGGGDGGDDDVDEGANWGRSGGGSSAPSASAAGAAKGSEASETEVQTPSAASAAPDASSK